MSESESELEKDLAALFILLEGTETYLKTKGMFKTVFNFFFSVKIKKFEN